jgi:hypothetical protein
MVRVGGLRVRRLPGKDDVANRRRRALKIPEERVSARKRGNEPAAGPALDREIERRIGGVEPGEVVPAYSTDDAAALELAQRFSRTRGWWFFEKREVFGGAAFGWIQESQPLFVSVHPIQASAPTRALAVCRSLLKVADFLESKPGAPPIHPRVREALA